MNYSLKFNKMAKTNRTARLYMKICLIMKKLFSDEKLLFGEMFEFLQFPTRKIFLFQITYHFVNARVWV